MVKKLIIYILFLICFLSKDYLPASTVEHSQFLIEKLQQTELINLQEIISSLNLNRSVEKDKWTLSNPYYPEYEGKELGYARKDVIDWYKHYDLSEEVCALRFIDSEKKQYVLQNFKNEYEAKVSGFIITHYKKCGACSSLKDLSIYMLRPNLTKEAKYCSIYLNPRKIRNCYEKKLGFTPACAQAWTYNSKHTAAKCWKICFRDYGLWSLISGQFRYVENNLPNGDLRPCLKCDEVNSGAGFKYASGRTRRNSNISSFIQREESEMYYVDHNIYFE